MDKIVGENLYTPPPANMERLTKEKQIKNLLDGFGYRLGLAGSCSLNHCIIILINNYIP